MGFLNYLVARFPSALIVLGIMLFFGTRGKGEMFQVLFGQSIGQLAGVALFLIGIAIIVRRIQSKKNQSIESQS